MVMFAVVRRAQTLPLPQNVLICCAEYQISAKCNSIAVI